MKVKVLIKKDLLDEVKIFDKKLLNLTKSLAKFYFTFNQKIFVFLQIFFHLRSCV